MSVSTCYRCGRSLGPGDFARDASKSSGRASLRRECDREKGRAYYRANRARVLARVNARNASLRAQRPAGHR